MTPVKVYDAANSMNYAFFKVVCEQVGISSEPFRTSQFRTNGEKLLALVMVVLSMCRSDPYVLLYLLSHLEIVVS